MRKKLVILGAQWGDEGKGKVVDVLSESFDLNVRYQGGANAGHTVVVEGHKTILHHLPTGILHKNTSCVIAQGMVVDLKGLKEELSKIKSLGIDYEGRLYLSDKVHLVLPYHKHLDALFEKKGKIGTTLRGIGPAYMFKYGRRGIRLADLQDQDRFEELVRQNVEFVKDISEKVFGEKFETTVDQIVQEYMSIYDRIKDFVTDTAQLIANFKGSILFEGAQGTMLDVDAGTYPYVTSSNSSALGLCNGTGLPPKFFADAYTVGVTKAYATRVGDGPFPTELKGKEGDLLRDLGGEYGSTTGRPRRCGWIDLVALKHAVETNGFDAIIITKLDVLDSFDKVKVCVAYEVEGERVERFPSSLSTLERCKPIYEAFEGWKTSTRGISSEEDLPSQARAFISFIEDFLGVPVVMVSTGPSREEFLWLKNRIRTELIPS